MSFAKPKTDRRKSSRRSAASNSALQNRKRIGNNGDPCRTLAASSCGAISSLVILGVLMLWIESGLAYFKQVVLLR